MGEKTMIDEQRDRDLDSLYARDMLADVLTYIQTLEKENDELREQAKELKDKLYDKKPSSLKVIKDKE